MPFFGFGKKKKANVENSKWNWFKIDIFENLTVHSGAITGVSVIKRTSDPFVNGQPQIKAPVVNQSGLIKSTKLPSDGNNRTPLKSIIKPPGKKVSVESPIGAPDSIKKQQSIKPINPLTKADQIAPNRNNSNQRLQLKGLSVPDLTDAQQQVNHWSLLN